MDRDWNLGIVKNSTHHLFCCESDPFIFNYFENIDMPMQISNSIDQVIIERKTGVFIQRFWNPTGVLVVTEGGNELVENNANCGVIGIFAE